jgi:hypothetical protein
MFKSKIISETKKSVANSMELLFKILNESIVPEEERITGSGRATSEASPDKSKLAYSASTSGSRIETSASREPRLNSSTLDGTVALEEVFENQRVSIFGKWGPNHLLPTDRARFTNRNGVVELSFEKTQLPPHWVWTSPWKIDHNYTECDEEGWSYATDFPRFKTHLERGKSNQKKLGASVRRRRWIRTMCYVPPENQA